MFTKANLWLNNFYNNPYVSSALLVFFLVYASMVAPELPPFLAGLFGNPIFKVLFMALILVVKQYNPTLALIVSIGFILSMQTFHRYESRAAIKDLTKSKVVDKVEEGISNIGTDVANAISELVGNEPNGFSGTVEGYQL